VGLAALVVAHQDVALTIAAGLVPLAVAAWLTAGHGRRARLAAATALIVVLAAVLLAAWLHTIASLLATGIASPFVPAAGHWRQMVLYHGIAWPALALAGTAVGLRRRPIWTLAVVTWLLVLADLSLTDVLAYASPLGATLRRFAYPFSIAWHGPLLPYLVLGTVAFAAAAGRWRWRITAFPGRATSVAAALALAAVGLALPWLAAPVVSRLEIYGALASRSDVVAMRWIRGAAPAGGRVLNYPGDLPHRRDWESHWAPVLTERDCVYFRMQPFFLDDPRAPRRGALAAAAREQEEMLAFWRDPADPRHAARLATAGIRYVLVPEGVGDPAAATGVWRGRPPALLDGRQPPALAVEYLREVFRAGGATVYEVVR